MEWKLRDRITLKRLLCELPNQAFSPFKQIKFVVFA